MFGDSAYPIEVSLARAIESGVPMLARCPDWFPPWLSFPGDEGVERDQALHPARRVGVRGARAALIETLRASVGEMPSSDWRIGQLVRFLVDQSDTSGASDAVARCRSNEAWCARVSGFVRRTFGFDSLAYEEFLRSVRVTSPGGRCTGRSLATLLDEWQAREQLRRMSCAAYDSVEKRFWWLSDPLWSEPGNERWVEHEARRVRVALHRSASPDERFHWSPEHGGAAVERMLIRYGWPSYVFWTGPDVERSYRIAQSQRDGLNVPKSFLVAALEYRAGRLALAPNWEELRQPFATGLDDWRFSAPVSRVRYTSERDPDLGWWPQEHFAPRRPLMQLASVQSAALPREHGVLRLVATDPAATREGGVLTSERDSLEARFLVGRGPEDVRSLATRRLRGGTSVVLEGLDSSAAAGLASLELVPLEARGRSDAPSRRARWGIPAMAPLRPDSESRIAVSMPILLGAPSGRASLPGTRDSTLILMLPSLDLGARPAIGVYWETYGLRDGDSVEIAVRVDREEARGLLGRLARAPKRSAVVVRWSEVVSDGGAREARGRGDARRVAAVGMTALHESQGGRAHVPIHGWWRVVDLSELAGEKLQLAVSIRRLTRGGRSEAVGDAVAFRRSGAE
jgi:hypothetical protein